MKIAILLCLLCAVYVYAGPVNLTPENFDSVVDGSKNVFIKFFAPWCGHCKAMVGAYEETAEAFAKESDVVIADVDADAHKELASRFGVTGFPTLKFFKKGSTEPEDYNGGREAADIVEWINKQAGSKARIAKAASAVEVLSPGNFDSIVLDSTKDVFVEFYAPWCGHCKRLTPIWEKLAGVFKGDSNVVIANVDADAHKDLGSKYGVTGFPTLIYFSKSDKSGERYSGARELTDLVAHVNSKAGTSRQDNGRLHATVGRDSTLDELAQKFVANPADRSSIVSEAETRAAAVSAENPHATWYAKFMNVIIKKGDDWIAKEQERVKGMLDGGNLSVEKVDEFSVRTNILSAFQSQ
jgi:protein disulfide-isomerase A6